MSRNREQIEQELERIDAMEHSSYVMGGVQSALIEELRSLGKKMANNWFENDALAGAYIEPSGEGKPPSPEEGESSQEA